jgi:hypothetical protein
MEQIKGNFNLYMNRLTHVEQLYKDKVIDSSVQLILCMMAACDYCFDKISYDLMYHEVMLINKKMIR